MGDLTRAQLARLLQRQADASKAAEFSAEAVCFGPQTIAARSRARRKSIDGSRRMGKSRGIGVEVLESVLEPPFTNLWYLTLTLKNSRRIIWPELKALNDRFNLGGVPNESEAYLRFPKLGPDVHVYLGGLKDPGEADKVRGPKAKKFFVDEAQLLPQRVIVPAMKEVIMPALLDVRGELVVAGTPGAVRAGYFWDITHGALSSEWEHHHWTWRDNPHIQPGRDRDEIEAEILKENKLTRDSPTFLREWCGQWVQDDSALVFKFADPRNVFTEAPPGRWSYVVGVDLGFEDADAIAVLGWREGDSAVYLVEESTVRKAGVTELAERIRDVVDRYKPIKVVADFGGLGKKIAEEIRRRHALPIEAADKVRKLEHIELLNDAMLGGRLKARAGGPFAEDCALVQWDSDARARGTLKIAEDYHSDITDAVLYAFRACMGWIEKPAETPAHPLPPNHEHLEALLRQQQRGADLTEVEREYFDS